MYEDVTFLNNLVINDNADKIHSNKKKDNDDENLNDIDEFNSLN